MCKNIKVFLDSGAHSLYTKEVMRKDDTYDWYESDAFWEFVDKYAAFIKENEKMIDVYVNVDVIFNPELTWKVQKYMEDVHKLKPLPVFHSGEDFKWLKKYIEGYEYIGMSGLGQRAKKAQWIKNVGDPAFRIVCDEKGYPRVKVHGFAMTSPDLMTEYPYYCMTEEDHTVLTKQGWSSLSDLSIGTEILAFDNGNMEWQEIEELPIFPVRNATLNHLFNRNFDAFVTPNHRWLVCEQQARGVSYKWKTTETLSSRDRINRIGKNYQFLDKPIYTDEQIGLLAWYWTDGTTHANRPRYKKGSITIHQSKVSNPDKCNIIRELLIKGKEKFCESVNKNGIIDFEFHGDIAEWILKIAPNKKLPSSLPFQLTKEQAKLFLKYSALADGTKSRGCFELVVKREVKKENVEVLRIICLLLGLPTSTFFGTKGYKGLRSSSVDYIYAHQTRKEILSYTGKLWCVKVKSGAFFTKCRDKVYVTGNSVDSTSWFQFGKYGLIIVPKKRNGRFIYDESPHIICVSTRKTKKMEAENFEHLPDLEKRVVCEYLEMKGFRMGSSTFGTKKFDRSIIQLPLEDTILTDDEIIIERGVCNDSYLRDELNLQFYLDMEANIPPWPRKWDKKVKSTYIPL